MRPYIIINGMNSALVDGLLISDLPDIKKPLKRTNIVEIDGRDGDIVQELGYSSYEKEITIGLHGKYDIDRVIQYFNGSGNIIFSNEPDKIYKYTILDEISYEKLNRYKTAKVKFHVQPFKFSALEKSRTFNVSGLSAVEVINRGNIYSRPLLTIYGSGDVTLKINGNSVLVLNIANSILIDAEGMNAYHNGQLYNRHVLGNYADVVLTAGKNIISWEGTVTKIEIDNYSRWI